MSSTRAITATQHRSDEHFGSAQHCACRELYVQVGEMPTEFRIQRVLRLRTRRTNDQTYTP